MENTVAQSASNDSFSKYTKAQKHELEEKLQDIFSNLYYTWNKDLYCFADKLDGYNWRKNLGPAAIIHRYLEEKSVVKQDQDFAVIEEGLNQQKKYLDDFTWFEEKAQFDKKLAKFHDNPILYLSAEYGLVDWIQIYSGGLGILAGDFIKQASDHGLPVVAIGIFYHQGYFHQDIDLKGMQQEIYFPQDPAACMLKLVKDSNDDFLEVSVTIENHEVFVRAWELRVGRIIIYLLDTNYDKNIELEDKMITAHLYGGTHDTRIRQEIVLGIGGYKFAQKLGIKPSVIHMNEGHASFISLQIAKGFVDEGQSFCDAMKEAKKHTLFTNHTLNPAGNDKFEYSLLKKYLEPYAQDLKTTFDELYNYGNDPLYSAGEFSMTILGMKTSTKCNAVSQLHGVAAQKLWPEYHMEAITNGVHMPTWVSKEMQELIDEYVDPDWREPMAKVDWDKIRDIPNEKLWSAHQTLKRQMIERVNTTLGTQLSSDALTVIWTRRFAAYKRPNIFLNDLDKIYQLTSNADRPIQFLVGGQAHPQDLKGKELLKSVIETCLDPKFKNKVTFLTAYNWNLARYVVAGTDIWLNNPIRFEEASGTSGMKAGANGVLQFSTLDGWTDEVDWFGKGWVLPQENIHTEIYRILEEEIATQYYKERTPNDWINMMKETMIVCLSRYNMGRMLEEYVDLYKELQAE